MLDFQLDPERLTRYLLGCTNPFLSLHHQELGNGDGTTDLLWAVRMGNKTEESAPAIYNGKVYILNSGGYLQAIEWDPPAVLSYPQMLKLFFRTVSILHGVDHHVLHAFLCCSAEIPESPSTLSLIDRG